MLRPSCRWPPRPEDKAHSPVRLLNLKKSPALDFAPGRSHQRSRALLSAVAMLVLLWNSALSASASALSLIWSNAIEGSNRRLELLELELRPLSGIVCS